MSRFNVAFRVKIIADIHQQAHSLTCFFSKKKREKKEPNIQQLVKTLLGLATRYNPEPRKGTILSR